MVSFRIATNTIDPGIPVTGGFVKMPNGQAYHRILVSRSRLQRNGDLLRERLQLSAS